MEYLSNDALCEHFRLLGGSMLLLPNITGSFYANQSSDEGVRYKYNNRLIFWSLGLGLMLAMSGQHFDWR